MADLQTLGQMNFKKICDECQENIAEVYCSCTGGQVYLCDKCFGCHRKKFPELRHELIPADAKVADMSAYRERCDALAKGKRELEQNIEKIDKCGQELEVAVGKIVRALTNYLQEKTKQLRDMRAILQANIDKAVNEAQSTLVQDRAQLKWMYTYYLRKYEKDSLVLFNYEIRPNLAEMMLRHMPNFALLGPGQYREKLLRLHLENVELFNFETETWGNTIPLSNTIKVDYCSAYTQVDMNRAFCCGLDPASVTSMNYAGYLIDFTSGSVEELRPLRVARNSPGVLHHEGELFVFGCNVHTAPVPTQRLEKKWK